MSDTLALRVLRYLPRNVISRVFGRIAAMRRPRWFSRWCIRAFARRFEVDLSEAERPIQEYESLLDLFTRRLKDGARPVSDEPDVLVSPVDGVTGACGRVREGTLLQAKGIDYTLTALLGSAAAAEPFSSGAYATIYLSPRDYHRIHAPVAGRITATLYEPGTLWPVNPPAVRTIPSLFAVNERITSIIETDRGPLAVCMVGATNVGRIRLGYCDATTNRKGAAFSRRHDPPVPIDRGGDLGVFELGSTVIVITAREGFDIDRVAEGRRVLVGDVLGRHSPQ